MAGSTDGRDCGQRMPMQTYPGQDQPGGDFAPGPACPVERLFPPLEVQSQGGLEGRFWLGTRRKHKFWDRGGTAHAKGRARGCKESGGGGVFWEFCALVGLVTGLGMTWGSQGVVPCALCTG